jgi:hypothetical protein
VFRTSSTWSCSMFGLTYFGAVAMYTMIESVVQSGPIVHWFRSHALHSFSIGCYSTKNYCYAFCILYYLCITVYVLLIVYVTLPPGIGPIAVGNKYNSDLKNQDAFDLWISGSMLSSKIMTVLEIHTLRGEKAREFAKPRNQNRDKRKRSLFLCVNARTT